MSQETETVEQVCDEMKEVSGTRRFIDSHYCNSCGNPIDGIGSPLEVYSDRILAAHKREIASLKSLVKELAHKLDLLLPIGCRVIECKNCKSICGRKDWIELISKAREACK